LPEIGNSQGPMLNNKQVFSSEDNRESSTQDDHIQNQIMNQEDIEIYQKTLANIENETLAKRFGCARNFVD